MKKEPAVHTIIVTYNGEEWIHKCLNSLYESTLKTEIIVIDNHSEDGTVQIIENEFNSVRLIKLNENIGFGQANNIGFKLAIKEEADYIFLINQDAWLSSPDTILTLLNSLKLTHDYGIISPIHLYGNGKRVILEKHYFTPVIHSANDLFSDLFLNKKLKDIYEVEYIPAAAWLMPIRTLKEIGGFDPLFFHYGEDDNYMQRLKYHKLKIGISPYAHICHDIEFRELDYNSLFNNLSKNLMVELSDIRKENILHQKKKHFIFRFLQQFFFLRFKSAYRYLEVLKLILKNEKAIMYSRSINKIKSPNWLSEQNKKSFDMNI